VLGILLISVVSTHCVFLLVRCRRRPAARAVRSFGDVGYAAFGRPGFAIVQLCLALSQTGFCCAYLIFIGENVSSMLGQAVSMQAVVMLCVPVLVRPC